MLPLMAPLPTNEALVPSVRLLPGNAGTSNDPPALILRLVLTAKAVPVALAAVAVLAITRLPNVVTTEPLITGAAPVKATVLDALAVKVPPALVHAVAPVLVTVRTAFAGPVTVREPEN